MTPPPTIDLNADLGEGGTQDAQLIALVSSANIACGGHAGDDETMRAAIDAALAAGVAIGAHPGYEDRSHFGRKPLNLGPATAAEQVSRQIERFATIAARAGAEIHHVKPHGALYLQADQDPELAAAIALATSKILPGCRFYVPPGGALARAGQAAGLIIRPEGFADRRYLPDGRLVPRSQPGAVIEDLETAVAHALRIACKHQVTTIDGGDFPLPAETLCVHGDGHEAKALLRALRHALEAAGFTIHA
jgi:UPF0271 protein